MKAFDTLQSSTSNVLRARVTRRVLLFAVFWLVQSPAGAQITLELTPLANTQHEIFNVYLSRYGDLTRTLSPTGDLQMAKGTLPFAALTVRNETDKQQPLSPWFTPDWKVLFTSEVGVVAEWPLLSGYRCLPSFTNDSVFISAKQACTLVLGREDVWPDNYHGPGLIAGKVHVEMLEAGRLRFSSNPMDVHLRNQSRAEELPNQHIEHTEIPCHDGCGGE